MCNIAVNSKSKNVNEKTINVAETSINEWFKIIDEALQYCKNKSEQIRLL